MSELVREIEKSYTRVGDHNVTTQYKAAFKDLGEKFDLLLQERNKLSEWNQCTMNAGADLMNQIAQLTKERDEEQLNRIGCERAMEELRRCCGLDTSKIDLREVKLHIDGIVKERDQLAAKCEKLCEELSGCVSGQIDPSVNVGWMRCSPDLPRYVQGLEAKVLGLIAAASDMIDFDQENQVPVCKCCGVELDEKGNGHRADCLANKILEACQ